MQLTVVIAPTEKGIFIEGALAALSAQEWVEPFEIIVPIDQTIESYESLSERYPNTRFIHVKGTGELATSSDIGIVHLAIDRRRAAGLAAAHGEIVALTEEHARPARDWCYRLIKSHQAPHAVIGGAIENGSSRLVNWALYFMDSGRYQNPLPEGPADYVSDMNVSYKRRDLEKVRALWREIYHETGVHDALRATGHTLWLTPKLAVWQDRGEVGFGRALRERFAWGRLYAGRRSQEVSRLRRVLLTLGSPLLALILPARIAKITFSRGRNRLNLIKAFPILLAMSSVWAVGELTGYMTGQATKATKDQRRKPGPFD